MVVVLYNEIGSQIKEQINSGIRKPGDKLESERTIAEKYGVSRNVVREALKSLSQQGLLVIKPGKGAYVCEPGPEILIKNLSTFITHKKQDLLDMLEVRENLEMLAVYKVCMNSTEEQTDKLEDIYGDLERVRYNVNLFMKKDKAFHEYLFKICGNKFLSILNSSFYTIMDEKIFKLRQYYPERVDQAQKDHRELLDAIKSKNSKKAWSVMKRHMNGLRFEVEKLPEKVEI